VVAWETGGGRAFSEALMEGFSEWGDILCNPPYEGNNDGIVSSEEAFAYADEWTSDDDTHPQINDQYDAPGVFQ
jgi:hypothetical protein